MITVSFEGEISSISANIPIMKLTELIRQDIEDNIYNERSYDGSVIAPLSPYTIRRKGHSTVFLDKGILRMSVDKKRIDETEAEVFIKPRRSLIASYLQHGTTRMPSRKFFGISNRIDKLIEDWLKKN